MRAETFRDDHRVQVASAGSDLWLDEGVSEFWPPILIFRRQKRTALPWREGKRLLERAIAERPDFDARNDARRAHHQALLYEAFVAGPDTTSRKKRFGSATTGVGSI